MECGERPALIVAALRGWRCKNPLDLRRQHASALRRLNVGHRKARTPDQMSFAMELFEHEGQRRAGRDCERLIQLEHCTVRFPLGGMDSPGRLLVPVERMFDRPARLI